MKKKLSLYGCYLVLVGILYGIEHGLGWFVFSNYIGIGIGLALLITLFTSVPLFHNHFETVGSIADRAKESTPIMSIGTAIALIMPLVIYIYLS
ncbi:hypothetical protein G7061_09550 [Erysipelothrix sp. HDW6B]|uniref:hypothetical protein n=1 Tax=Erysipelothrix sp. HDW6B TaxID=2714929 RepID=UPI00140B54FD|nr:hypothetical protein [Erysipelothrix sp. HDW6B]QIK86844.1 hypothetical protein G7061_09550 [Erysipelothrix sp. HDW6B]